MLALPGVPRPHSDLEDGLPLTHATWQKRGRSLRLNLKQWKKTIGFGEHPLARRRELVRYFHERIDPGLQSGWDDSLEEYADPKYVIRALGEYQRTYYRLLRPLILGPIFGLACGFLLSLSGLEAATWTGSFVLDGIVRGTLVSIGLLATLWIVHWIDQPESPPAEPRIL